MCMTYEVIQPRLSKDMIFCLQFKNTFFICDMSPQYNIHLPILL